MWILKNSPTLLSTIKSNNLKKVDYISTWDFSTLYNTIQHDQLKSRICILTRKSFSHGNNNYIKVSCNGAFFSVEPYKKPGYVAWIQTEFIQAFTFLIDNIYM